MASIEKRVCKDGSTHYRVKVRMRGFPSQTASFKRKTDAKRWAEETESAIRAGRFFRNMKTQQFTLSDAIDRYRSDVLPQKKSGHSQLGQLDWWETQYGEYALTNMTVPLLVKARNRLKSEPNAKGKVRTPATVNRYLAVLSHLFTMAVNEWHWVDENPLKKLTRLKEAKGRVRYLEKDELDRLLEACRISDNKCLYLIVILALSTGARRGEILSLTWKDIDLKRGMITFHETKNGERRSVFLSEPGLSLLIKHSKVRHMKNTFVFPSQKTDEPIQIQTAWETVIKRAELKDFRFHDLRHTAASYLAMNGATPNEIAAVLGHKTLQMVKRYAHLSETHLSTVVSSMTKRFLMGAS